MDKKVLTVNGREVEFTDERNLLEVIRKAGVEIPTFCYHSDLSVYGACRLCLVEVEGTNGRPNAIMASCSTAPAPGMSIRTETKEIRAMRKVAVELLLANHNTECPTCVRSEDCKLRKIARQLGVEHIRYKKLKDFAPIDVSSPSLQRDPNKCVLCGDCVRVCSEVQGIGAINFANRGSNAQVVPAFGAGLGEVECVNCGQCAAVCPTGAITPKQDVDKVWAALYDPTKTVVVEIAPAVRVAVGEQFGAKPGENFAGKLVAALRIMGFKRVFDTCFSADMTIFEEATEFLDRFTKKEDLPLFTSCCPAWVKFCETYYPEMRPNLSTCRSPQGMFGSVAKKILPEQLGCKREDLVVVSIMPCTAKKFEAGLDKFKVDGVPETDIVITTSEVQRMISSLGIKLDELEPEAFDMPLGFSTGAGVIFGTSGGVMEAALRFAVEKATGKTLENVDFKMVRGMDKIKEATLETPAGEVRIAVCHGLASARALIEKIKSGEAKYDFVEVMACPGGCISGGGQPFGATDAIRKQRQAGMYVADKTAQLQKSQDNYLVDKCYQEHIGGGPGSHEAHELLHTTYENRSRAFDAVIPALRGTDPERVSVIMTVRADSDPKGGEKALKQLVDHIKASARPEGFDVDVAFAGSGEESVEVGGNAVPGFRTPAAMKKVKGLVDAAC
ncbi:MAG: iron hydrogenase small subunit [Thermoguttaceae bacterium]|nr:iron hydrogenase small subunit [Thermoguttaceae bacterium]